MADRSPPPRGKLLVTVALSATTVWLGCGSDRDRELPANPKGSGYDDGTALPANPKGSLYDQTAMPTATADASASAVPTATVAASASATPSAAPTASSPPTKPATGKK